MIVTDSGIIDQNVESMISSLKEMRVKIIVITEECSNVNVRLAELSSNNTLWTFPNCKDFGLIQEIQDQDIDPLLVIYYKAINHDLCDFVVHHVKLVPHTLSYPTHILIRPLRTDVDIPGLIIRLYQDRTFFKEVEIHQTITKSGYYFQTTKLEDSKKPSYSFSFKHYLPKSKRTLTVIQSGKLIPQTHFRYPNHYFGLTGSGKSSFLLTVSKVMDNMTVNNDTVTFSGK